jgi:hypothetical protein
VKLSIVALVLVAQLLATGAHACVCAPSSMTEDRKLSESRDVFIASVESADYSLKSIEIVSRDDGLRPRVRTVLVDVMERAQLRVTEVFKGRRRVGQRLHVVGSVYLNDCRSSLVYTIGMIPPEWIRGSRAVLPPSEAQERIHAWLIFTNRRTPDIWTCDWSMPLEAARPEFLAMIRRESEGGRLLEYDPGFRDDMVRVLLAIGVSAVSAIMVLLIRRNAGLAD